MRVRTLFGSCVLAPMLLLGCGDDPQTAEGDELPKIDGAEVVDEFEEPSGIIEATILFQVVTHPSFPDAAQLVKEERQFLLAEGWKVRRERQVPGAFGADRNGIEDFIRFGTPKAMRRAAMGPRAGRELLASSAPLTRSMVIQISPPGPPPPE